MVLIISHTRIYIWRQKARDARRRVRHTVQQCVTSLIRAAINYRVITNSLYLFPEYLTVWPDQSQN